MDHYWLWAIEGTEINPGDVLIVRIRSICLSFRKLKRVDFRVFFPKLSSLFSLPNVIFLGELQVDLSDSVFV